MPVNHGIELFNVLQNRGVPSKLVYFPDENHWILKGENSRFFYDEVDGAIFEFENKRIHVAIRAAHDRGAKIKILYDGDSQRGDGHPLFGFPTEPALWGAVAIGYA